MSYEEERKLFFAQRVGKLISDVEVGLAKPGNFGGTAVGFKEECEAVAEIFKKRGWETEVKVRKLPGLNLTGMKEEDKEHVVTVVWKELVLEK